MKVFLQVKRSVRSGVPLGLRRALKRKVAAAARRVGVAPDAELTVVLTDDAEIAELHERFMDLQGPTDVLSFPAEVGPDGEPRGESLGDLVIGWPFAVRQSAARGVGPAAWQDEVIDLALHGLAHLLGHDHRTRPQARAMLRLERRLARRAAMPVPQRPYA